MTSKLPETDMKKFGELSKEEKLALFEAWLDGHEIEARPDGSAVFKHTERPDWFPDAAYKVAERKPSIDWSHVSPIYKYLATDKDGRDWLHISAPRQDGDYWTSAPPYNTGPVMADAFVSYVRGNCDWKNSLVEREGRNNE